MEALLKLVAAAVKQHPENIEASISQVVKRATGKTWWTEIKDDIIRKGIAKLVHDCRHNINTSIRRSDGSYGGPAKVTAGDAVNRIASECYGYMIAGTTLGSLTGEDLLVVGPAEAARADGHQFNAQLCAELAKLVKGTDTVAVRVTERKLKGLFDKLK